MEYDNTNKIALFAHDKKGNEKAPDFKGKVNIDGTDYPISVWKKFTKKGEMLSGSVDKPKDHSESPKGKPEEKFDMGGGNIFDDDIPF